MDSGKVIRVYFRDELHGQSYLSFNTEAEAVQQIRKVQDRFRSITIFDEATCRELFDAEVALRIIKAAAQI